MTERDMTEQTSDSGPVVQGALLRSELRGLRYGRDETQEEVARVLEWSVSKLIRIEGGAVRISRTDLEALLRHYGVTDQARIDRLAALARGARAAGWWANTTLSDKAYISYLGYETGASLIKTAQSLLIPGLLQTKDYARLIAEAYVTSPMPTEIDDVVNTREKRQEVVRKRKIKQIHLIDEAAIRRHVGNAMPEQLRHLVELAENHREIQIRIIPFEAGPHFGMKGLFGLLSFADGLEDVLYLESSRRGDLLIAGPGGDTVAGAGGDPTAEKVGIIAEYREAFDQMTKLALGQQASLELIERVANELS